MTREQYAALLRLLAIVKARAFWHAATELVWKHA